MSDRKTDSRFDVKAIFNVARQIDTVEARAEYLRQVSDGDPRLISRVTALLAGFGQQSGFLESPPLPVVSTLVESPAADSPSSLPEQEALGTMIGPYKLREVLGEGGMGIVYIAEQEKPLRRKVALKVIKPGMDTREVIARFEAERQALALMDHPNIAKVLDAGTTGEEVRSSEFGVRNETCDNPSTPHSELQTPHSSPRPYFVMELVRGLPITDYCDQRRLSPRERLKLFITVCQAVQHAHQRGIIHRDLKPSNVMITMHDGTPVPKVIDFGVAKALNQKLTEHTLYTRNMQMVGTPLYMSPEQAELSGLDVDTRSDVYSLGVLLYELLTGQTPFDKETFSKVGYDEMRRMIREDEPPRPSHRVSTLAAEARSTVAHRRSHDERQLSKTLHGELEWIVMKALEKDRTRRYESASELAQDVERYLEGMPVEACPPSFWYCLRKFVRRNRVTFATGAAVAAALLIGTVVSIWQAVEAEHARKLADERLELADSRLTLANERLEAEQLARQEAESERRRSDMLSTRAQLDVATVLLRDGDSRGLLEIVEARQSAQRLPDMCALTAEMWSIAHQIWEGKLALILPGAESVSMHPDGRILALANNTKAYLWDVQTGRLWVPPLEMGKLLSVVRFSPDGKLVVTHSAEGVSRMWDVASGCPTSPLLTHGDSHIKNKARLANHLPYSAAFHPDGRLLATGCSDGTVRFWKTPDGEPYGTALPSQGGPVTSLAFSPNGKMLAVSTFLGAGNVYVWSVEHRDQLLSPLSHEPAVDKVVFSPNGEQMASIATSGSARIWDTATGAVVRDLKVRNGYPEDVAYNSEGSRIAIGATDWTATLWDPASDQPQATLQHQGLVRSVAFSPNGVLVATASTDHTARTWESSTGDPAFFPLRHQSEVWRVLFSPDGALLVTSGSEFEGKGGSTRVWNLKHSPWEPLVALKTMSSPAHLSISSDLRLVASVSYDRAMIEVRDISSLALVGQPIHIGPNERITRIAFTPDGKELAIGIKEVVGQHSVRFWDFETHQFLDRRVASNEITTFAYRGDGRQLAIARLDWRVGIWDFTSEQILPEIFCHERPYGATFTPDGRKLVTGTRGGLMQQWSLPSGEPFGPPMVHPNGIFGVACSPSGRQLASVTTAGDSAGEGSRYVARIWFVGAGPPYPHLVLPCRPSDRFVQFTSDGDLLLSGETPGTIIRWRMNRTPESFAEIQTQTWKALGLRRREDGQTEPIPWQEWQAIAVQPSSVE